MSLIKVQSEALKKIMMPFTPVTNPDLEYSPGKDGMAARLHKCSLECEGFDVGEKVCISRLNKRCLFLRAASPLELKASYELVLQGFYVLDGYLTPSERDSTEYCYQFHSDTWLTDEQIMKLAIDF
ncbi:hypothetical protein [Photobacterium sp. J15]|uniref:hypothetical protein n=1 Tax=Photobacterium sp. J15 TaxID=265901 RepID=UPI000A584266|nr:hypothetical protein [Photobacterium sp. J15]